MHGLIKLHFGAENVNATPFDTVGENEFELPRLHEIISSIHVENWSEPIKTLVCNNLARPGYSPELADEYQDDEETLNSKISLLASLIKISKNCTIYTGAGISRASGIMDYASATNSGLTSGLLSPLDALPSKSHHILASLMEERLFKHWIQQNHDGLPQKAGVCQSKLNEIHGAWFDPSNPGTAIIFTRPRPCSTSSMTSHSHFIIVIPIEGHLREDLFHWLIEVAESADLVLALGTSLSGMNADLVVTECSERSLFNSNNANRNRKNRKKSKTAIGSVIINLQKTILDNTCALRIFGNSDDVLSKLQNHLQLPLTTTISKMVLTTDGCQVYNMDVPSETVIEPHVYLISYDRNGNYLDDPTSTAILDLREGAYVRITGGMFAGDCGEVLTPNRFGHYRIRFVHSLQKSTSSTKKKNKAPMQRVLGCWWIELGCRRIALQKGLRFPVVSCSLEEAEIAMKGCI